VVNIPNPTVVVGFVDRNQWHPNFFTMLGSQRSAKEVNKICKYSLEFSTSFGSYIITAFKQYIYVHAQNSVFLQSVYFAFHGYEPWNFFVMLVSVSFLLNYNQIGCVLMYSTTVTLPLHIVNLRTNQLTSSTDH
jgi:hypothetical protein